MRAVKRAREEALIAQYGAVGLGIGRQGDAYVLVVYLRAAREGLAEPVFVDGVRLKFEVTGRFGVQ